MKGIIKNVLSILLSLISLGGWAQEKNFCGKVYNADYDVFFDFNLYEETVVIPGQEVLGKVFGYLKKTSDSRVWIIMSVELSPDGKTAKLEMVNDYGSDDLMATLAFDADGSVILRQEEGSNLKVAGKGKWIKLPKMMVFKQNNN